MNSWRVIQRCAWSVLGLLIVAGLACVFVPKCHGIRDLHRRKVALEAENEETRRTIAELRMNQERFASDPAFVERTARENDMVRPDEVMFKFTNAVKGSAPEEPR